MNSLLKGTAVVLIGAAYVIIASVLALLPAGGTVRRMFLIRNTSFFSRIFLRLFGIRVHHRHGGRLRPSVSGRLMVSNHVSYLDVLVIASLTPSVFVTSVELGSTVLLGALARLGGSLFVERRKATGLKGELAAIAELLDSGFTVLFFPESTTSNGDRVHPFKNALFEAARMAGSDILPLCLRYTRVNARSLTTSNRDSVYYYGGATFLPHLAGLIGLKSVDVEVAALARIRPSESSGRKELAAQAHEAISNAYRPSDANN